jgi:uncharacterized protein (TIGR03000 family)
MKRWLAVLATLAAVSYFGYVRESDARGLRRGRAAACRPCPPPCPAPVWWCSAPEPAAAPVAPVPPPPTAVAPPETTPTPEVTTPPAPPPPPPPAAEAPGKLHALFLVDDTNKDTGVPNKAGATLLERVLRAGLPAARLGTVETLTGEAVTRDRVRATLAALAVGPRDALVCYYAGAATYNEAARTYLLTPAAAAGAGLPRDDLRAALLDRHAQLTVLLTDTTSNPALPEMLPPLPAPAGPAQLEALFFRNRGVVDLQAAAASENAFPRGNEGGLFTLALVEELTRRRPGGPPASWPALVDEVRATTDRLYKDFRRAVLASDKVADDDKRPYRDQPAQTPTTLTPLDQVSPVAPPSAPTDAGEPALILVRIPAGATLFIEDRPTEQTGATRRFETPDLEPGRVYTYTLRAELPRGDGTATETHKVSVSAGETAQVSFVE